MNRDFTTYSVVVELQEIGFNENCYATIDQIDYLYIKGTPQNPRGSMDYDTRDCPTFYQVFRWFRDVHGLNGVIEGSKKHGFEWCIFPDLDYYMKPPNNFNTYEEAEMACLRRLIEVVKEKK